MSMLPPEMEASSGPPRCNRDAVRLPGLPPAIATGALKPAALACRLPGRGGRLALLAVGGLRPVERSGCKGHELPRRSLKTLLLPG